MGPERPILEYEPVSSRAGMAAEIPEVWGWTGDSGKSTFAREEVVPRENLKHVAELSTAESVSASRSDSRRKAEGFTSKSGHGLSYAGLYLFTAILYFRPYELFSGLTGLSSMAFWVALPTLLIFFASQLTLEGNLTARISEVNLVLLLVLAALLSIPTAINPGEAWDTFSETFIKAVLMFIVIVNAVRTERRLMGMLWLTLGVSLVLSVGALNDYRLGNLAVEGYRVKGMLGGMFGNPNDMALHLVTMLPITVALMLSARGIARKFGYLVCAVLMVGAIAVTFSRGGLLGLVAVTLVLSWKLRRKSSFAIFASLFAGVLFLVMAPSSYGGRLLSIVLPSQDAVGSSTARWELLKRSILVALRHPLLGIGMGNFHIVSIQEHVSHNAYTQVASEMGMAALVIYVLFMVKPLKALRRIEDECISSGNATGRQYYLALGLQASIIGYMVSSFFASVAYYWYVYYLVGYAVVVRRSWLSNSEATIASDYTGVRGVGGDQKEPAALPEAALDWAGEGA